MYRCTQNEPLVYRCDLPAEHAGNHRSELGPINWRFPFHSRKWKDPSTLEARK